MLVEVIVAVAFCIWVSGSLVGLVRKNVPVHAERPPPPVMRSQKAPSDPIIKLVRELLQRDGWVQEGKYLYHAQADIRLLRIFNRDDPQWRVFIKNNEHYENAGLTLHEEIQIGKLVNAYSKKQAEQRKLALAKVVSDRIIKQMFLDQPGLVISGPSGTATVGSPARHVEALEYSPGTYGQPLETMSRHLKHAW